MKKIAKPFSVILIMVIIIFSIFSVFGFSYYYGDIKNTVIRGFSDLNFDSDIGKSTLISVAPSSEDEAAGEVVEVIKERAAKIGLMDYQLYIQDETQNVVLSVPNDVDCGFDAAETVSFLISMGNVTIRPGIKYEYYFVDSLEEPAFANPMDETADSILINSKYITEAVVSEHKDGDEETYTLDISLSGEGSNLISQLSSPDNSSGMSYYNETISIWVDDRMIGYRTLSEPIYDGVLSFDVSSLSRGKMFASVIDSGTMPCRLTVHEFEENEPTAGNSPVDMLMLMGTCVLILLAFVLIYRYRAGGFVILVSVFFHFSLLLAFFTRFTGKRAPFMMNLPAFAAYMLSVLVTVFGLIMAFERIKKNSDSDKNLSEIITSGFKSVRTKIFDINIIFILMSLSVLFVFGMNGFSLTLFGNAVNNSVYRFADVMLFGSVLSFISGYFLPKFLVKQITAIKLFNKPSMLGGKK